MQKVIRTKAKKDNSYVNGKEYSELSKLLEKGYAVVMCNAIGDELEYIVEKQ